MIEHQVGNIYRKIYVQLRILKREENGYKDNLLIKTNDITGGGEKKTCKLQQLMIYRSIDERKFVTIKSIRLLFDVLKEKHFIEKRKRKNLKPLIVLHCTH